MDSEFDLLSVSVCSIDLQKNLMLAVKMEDIPSNENCSLGTYRLYIEATLEILMV